MDIDEVERETIHMLVFLFMQFLSHSEQTGKLSASEQEEHSKKDHDHHNAGNTLAGQPCGKVKIQPISIIFTVLRVLSLFQNFQKRAAHHMVSRNPNFQDFVVNKKRVLFKAI